MKQPKGKRRKLSRAKAKVPPFAPVGRYSSYGNGLQLADIMRRRLFDEADFLSGIGNELGDELRAVVADLPYSSLERIHKG